MNFSAVFVRLFERRIPVTTEMPLSDTQHMGWQWPIAPPPDRVSRHSLFRLSRVLSLALLGCLFPGAGTAAAAALPSYTVGDSVCVQYDVDWRWYEAQITAVAAASVKVHYPEYGSAWDEWAELDRVNPRYSPVVGAKVWVEWNLGYYTGTILAKNATQYQVHYEGYDSSWDEWVNPCRLFPLPVVNDPVWVKWRKDWYYAKVLAIGTNSWQVHYAGYASTWDETVDPTRIMPCPPAQAAKAETGGSATAPAAVPSATQVHSYAAVRSPVTDTDPTKARPIGLGDAAHGGKILTLSLSLPAYASAVDVYFGLTYTGASDIYLLSSDGNVHSLSAGLVPFSAGITGPLDLTLIKDLSMEGLPEITYSFFLLVTPAKSLATYDLWLTSFQPSSTGIFTGQPLWDTAALLATLGPVVPAMVAKGNAAWYTQVEQFISSYSNADGAADPKEARFVFLWAAYLQDQLHPFCWAAVKAVEAAPTDALALNAAAVCLLELDQTDNAGRVLDFAHYQDAALSLTHENAAAYFDRKGDASRAATEKLAALDGEPSWAHDAWDGYHYAKRKGLAAAAGFDSRIPLNYSLLKTDGTQGKGEAKTLVCCSCNGKFYDNVVVCVDECEVTLACFTSICTPRLQCCGQKTPFSLETGLCYPPAGLQVCIEADSTGSYTVKLGGKLAGIFGGYVGVSGDFKGNYNAALSFSGSTGAKASVTLLSSDPKARIGAAKYIWNPSGSVAGGVGFGANLELSNWPQSPICELSAPASTP